MPLEHDRDPLPRDHKSGYLTTGHEWNGITELNTPVPKLVFFCLAVTFVFSLGYWVLMPAFPVGTTYTRGLLGFDQRTVVTQSVKQAALDRTVWTDRITKLDYAGIQRDPQLMSAVRQTGRTLFGDNCAVCHGRDARGGPGFPNLTTGSWLWGGSPDEIAETIRVGINSPHPKSRNSQMPAFGRDQVLPRPDMENVTAYLLSLGHPAVTPVAGKADAGKAVFTANCAICHGPDARGKRDVGSPNLTDALWQYGADQDSIYASIWGGRQGHMPSWEDRLSPVDRKILSLYLVDLRQP
jgi:cytochrome c oxidase cbb3-type subunit 3